MKLTELQTAIDTAVAAGVGAAGWYSYLVVHDNGETQKQINDYIGATWYERVGGYGVNDEARLSNGEVVISTIPSNTNNPNSDMAGWIKASNTIEVGSISELLSISNPLDKTVVKVLSYYVSENKGGGNFVFFSGDTTTLIMLVCLSIRMVDGLDRIGIQLVYTMQG